MRNSLYTIAALITVFLVGTNIMDSPEEECFSFYVSSSIGDDSNPGTDLLPFKTIKRIKQENKVDSIFLKRGDVFNESISGYKNCFIGAYGDGFSPILSGFIIISPNESYWELVTDSIWRLNLNQVPLIGYSKYDSIEPEFFFNIGSIYQFENNKIYGHLVSNFIDLRTDGDFYTTSYHLKEDLSQNPLGVLFIRWPENPATMGTIGLTPYNGAVYNLNNCTVKDLAVVGFGYGMFYLSYTDILNCKLDIIGGQIHIGKSYWCRCGNGIELWTDKYSSRDNCLIRNCQFSRTYDCAMTIQGLGDTRNVCNVVIDSSLFVHCRQAFEHFITNEKSHPIYVDCRFSDNTCIFMGDNCFNSPISREANLLSYETEPVNIEISRNIFYGGNHYCARFCSNMMKDNQVYLYDNQFLFQPISGAPIDSVLYSSSEDIIAYRFLTGDNSSFLSIELGSKEDFEYQNMFLHGFEYPASILAETFGK